MWSRAQIPVALSVLCALAGGCSAAQPPPAELLQRGEDRLRTGQLDVAAQDLQLVLTRAGRERALARRAHLGLGRIGKLRRDASVAGRHFRAAANLGEKGAEPEAKRAESFCRVEIKHRAGKRHTTWREAFTERDDFTGALTPKTEEAARHALCGEAPCAERGPSARRDVGENAGGALVGAYLAGPAGILALDPLLSQEQIGSCIPSVDVEVAASGDLARITATLDRVQVIHLDAAQQPCTETAEGCDARCATGERSILAALIDQTGRGLMVTVTTPGDAVYDPPTLSFGEGAVRIQGCATEDNEPRGVFSPAKPTNTMAN